MKRTTKPRELTQRPGGERLAPADWEKFEFLSRRQAKEYLRARGIPVSDSLLEKLAHHRRGPVYYRFGRRTFYKLGDLNLFVESQRVNQ